MSGFESNLVAEAIGLVVGLIITYFIVEKLLRRQEERTWKPARRRLLSAVKKQCEGAFIGWARKTVPPRLEAKDFTTLSADQFADIVAQLDVEILELKSVEAAELFDQRPHQYWRGQIRSLATLKDSLHLVVDRAQLTLRDEPDLVEPIADMETAFMQITGFDDQLRLLESLDEGDGMDRLTSQVIDRLLPMGALYVVNAFEAFLRVWRRLPDVAGRYS